MFDHVGYAVGALFRTLRDQLPAALAAADAAARPKFVCPPGPYVIAASSGLKLNGSAISLTAGAARTATQVAGDVNAVLAGVATADADGRLVLTGAAAPTATTPARLRFAAPASPTVDALGALGIDPGWDDRVVLALASPAPRFLERQLAKGDSLDRTIVSLEDVGEAPEQPRQLELHKVRVTLAVTVRGVAHEYAATQEAMRTFVAKLTGVVWAGDGRGRQLIGSAAHYSQVFECVHMRSRMKPTSWELEDSPGVAVPFGRAFPEFEIGVQDLG